MEVRKRSDLTDFDIKQLEAKGCTIEMYTVTNAETGKVTEMAYIIHPMLPKQGD